MGGLVSFSISFTERFSNKIHLPFYYEPNQIYSFFRLRPEKVIMRFSQIFFEIFKFSILLVIDNFLYPQENFYFREKPNEKNKILKTKAIGEKIIFQKNSPFFKKIKIENSTKDFRLKNIFQ